MGLLLGNGPDARIEIRPGTLLRHFVCLGSSGSGKTVACKVLCEELARHEVPVIAIDPQGDIASLALPGDREDLERRGLAEVYDEFHRKAEVLVWTPASTVGLPICINPLQFDDLPKRRERLIKALQMTSASLAGLLNYDPDSDTGKYAIAFFNVVFEQIVKRGETRVATFSDLADFLSNLPQDLQARASKVAGERLQKEIAQKINVLSVGANALLFDTGTPLNIDTLLGRKNPPPPGKTRVSVIYLNTLSTQAEKEFFLAELCLRLYQWMLAHPSTTPQALFYIDEAAPYLPPVRKPACKDALKMLFKQARKYGVCCTVATQNPGDLDYKALSQFGTWNLGRIPVQQDLKKVQAFIKGIAPGHVEEIAAQLPGLGAGRFKLLAPDEFTEARDLQVRWLVTKHVTLDEDAIAELVPDSLRERMTPREPDPAPEPPMDEPVEEPGEPMEDVEEEPDISEPMELDGDGGDELAPSGPEVWTAEPEEEEAPVDVLGVLTRLRRVATLDEIAAEAGVSPRRAAGRLDPLVKSKAVTKVRSGQRNLYWVKEFGFRPDLGLTAPVDVARTMHDESSIRSAVLALHGGRFGRKAEILDSSFEHVPLYRVEFEAVSERRRILFFIRRQERRQESIYLSLDGRKVCAFEKQRGLVFSTSPEGKVSDLVDLDDLCSFDRVLPASIKLSPSALKKRLPERNLVREVSSRFAVEVTDCEIVFLPCWEFRVRLKDRRREIRVVMDASTRSVVEL